MKFALFVLLAVTTLYTTGVHGEEEQWCGNVTAKDVQCETRCRKELPTHHDAFYAMAAVVVFTNLVFLAASIYLFVFVSKAVDDAGEKAHQLVDAVLVVLLPDELLRVIEAGENRTRMCDCGVIPPNWAVHQQQRLAILFTDTRPGGRSHIIDVCPDEKFGNIRLRLIENNWFVDHTYLEHREHPIPVDNTPKRLGLERGSEVLIRFTQIS